MIRHQTTHRFVRWPTAPAAFTLTLTLSKDQDFCWNKENEGGSPPVLLTQQDPSSYSTYTHPQSGQCPFLLLPFFCATFDQSYVTSCFPCVLEVHTTHTQGHFLFLSVEADQRSEGASSTSTCVQSFTPFFFFLSSYIPPA